MSKKVCSNCEYCIEGIVSDGKGTHVFSCAKIRGGRFDCGEFERKHMKVSKNKRACEFYKDMY